MGLAHTLGKIAPTPVKTWKWRRHQRRLLRTWGVEAETREFVVEHGLEVLEGPFTGLRFPEEAVRWEQASLIPCLQGTYECELYEHLGRPDVFIDVGSAYGFYLVGMALRGAHSYGFEIDRVRRAGSRRLAALNGVSDRVRVSGRLRPRDLDELSLENALLLCDVEGAEKQLFSADLVRRLHGVRIIVEFHHGSESQVTSALRHTHNCEVVKFDGRSNEFRPADQAWGIFLPRA